MTVFRESGEDTGYLYAADIETEEWLWRVETGEDYSDLPPAVHDGSVFVTDHSGALYAVSKTDGTIRWTFETEDTNPSVPRVDNDRVYVASGRTLYAVDINTGEKRWHVSWNGLRVGISNSCPLVTPSAIYIGTSGGMYAFDLS